MKNKKNKGEQEGGHLILQQADVKNLKLFVYIQTKYSNIKIDSFSIHYILQHNELLKLF